MYVILNFVAPVVEETTQCSGEVKIRIISKLTLWLPYHNGLR